MINDAVQTYFEIPEQYSSMVGYYMPMTAEHLRLGGAFRRLVAIEKNAAAGLNVCAKFDLAPSEIV